MGEKTNRLALEKSPYLLQHAFNPVDWYPWGEEAFVKAKAEDKPIFLSIGYSTCHWCHVMAHESFENSEIAVLLNQWFVSIKVDREERPDIDSMYMAATQAISGSGGWPMSVFLFPDGRPFYAGTYFPPESRYGRSGFPQILSNIHEAWKNRRNELDSAAGQFIKAIEASAGKTDDGVIGPDVFESCFSAITGEYDGKYGGFGQKPKFPRPVVLNFLLRYWYRTKNEHALTMVLQTLEKMAGGGMHDQLGGGFHRYSVDEFWLVPHFEKMLYDQSQLLNSYLDAYQITQNQLYADVARAIVGYVLRDLRDPDGAFYSAEDADSDDPYEKGRHGEGAFYLWTKEEIVKTLDQQAAKIFQFCYGIENDGNVEEDPQKEFTGKNILYLKNRLRDTARYFNVRIEEIEKSLNDSKAVLFAKRSSRQRPYRDDKIITAWNGLMIGALARASAVLHDREMSESANKAAFFIWKHLYDEKKGTLKRRYRQGSSGPVGQLEDYAFLVSGLIDLYQLDQESRWLQWAVELTETQIRLFWDKQNNAFFDSVEDNHLLVRMKEAYDGAEPAGNSIAAMNLLRLGLLTSNDAWQEKAAQIMDYFSEQIKRYPPAMVQMLCAWDQHTAKQEQIVIAGKRKAEDTENLLKKVHESYSPGRLVLLAAGGENQQFLAQKLPFLKDVAMIDGKATAYVCRNFTCNLPVTDPEELEKLLDPMPR
jgi:hypothetical protein